MSVNADIQSLEPGKLVDLFEVETGVIGVGTLRFHGYTNVGFIFWQGNAYSPWPIEAKGFARTSDRPPSPTLAVGNIDGSIGALCLAYQDMVGARVVRHRTLSRYLDAANFPGGNPTADPNEHMPPEIWYIDRKSGEDDGRVEFELGGADIGGLRIPKRQIVCDHCPWTYRGPDCGYSGPPVATIFDVPTADANLDNCSKKITGCRIRFGEDAELPHGGFAAAGLMRT